MVSLTFQTRKPFTGRVYVRGLADDDRCSRNFASNVDQNKFSMMIQNGDCTMQRQRVTGSLEVRSMYSFNKFGTIMSIILFSYCLKKNVGTII